MVHFIEIIIFGALVLLSFLLIANPFKTNAVANRWLGVFTFLWSLYWLEEIIFLATNKAISITSIPVVGFVQFLLPITFYLCVKYFTNPNYRLRRRSLLILVVPIVYLFILIWQQRTGINLQVLLIAFLLLHSLFYVTLSYVCIFKHQKQIQRFASNTVEIDLRWLEYIIIVLFLVTLLFAGFNILFYEAPLNLIMNGITLCTVFFIAYYALKQKEIYPVDEQERCEALNVGSEDETVLPKRKLLTDEKLVELKSQLNELMQDEELYLDTELNLISLSKHLQISTNHLSYVINNGFDENFYSYINKFRIEKAKLLLNDKRLAHLSIIGIAYESGFSSKTSFNTTFKKMTGLTPSEYKNRCSDL
ncbi:helix-turn-helix domain-containing protein [Carboxylicivirga taeanensis]|uniref:helix-turn-helix domain-containing protein n=1 Tax=Carboxylicivirga taeanensis TaxID=1416875 RepID=UPI003F6DEB2E